MPDTSSPPLVPADLSPRVRELERERTQLVTLVDILQEIAGTLNFVDILQTITQKLGETFGLDRCSIFLGEQSSKTARLVASYEDPSIRNYVVDLGRYPELKRSLDSGEVVFIPDAQDDPNLKHIRGALANRNVKTITVVPITWRRVAIGAIFLRTDRDGRAFSEQDIAFTQAVAAVAAKALRVVYRYDRLLRRHEEQTEAVRRTERERIALIAYLRRLMESVAERPGHQSEEQLGRTVVDELDRLVDITMAVLAEEGKGR
ncbi:MAG: GAF domain-containing protein [Gemmatimonadota bacterium]|nr:GAF domain-containing protein [Gemmatimonadota bacterium]MDH4350271.1 GAF domain-containing protein [Gemmatimonadota bacterium]